MVRVETGKVTGVPFSELSIRNENSGGYKGAFRGIVFSKVVPPTRFVPRQAPPSLSDRRDGARLGKVY